MNRTEINVTLEEETTMIGEVVAIGYGSQRKEDLSMAVTTVKVDDAARSRASDLGTLLQGRMPGVTVMQSGDPMQKASFSIRGRGSKGNDQGTDRGNDGPSSGDGVLVVVDGVPNAPYMVEDIETITVLKDAASAAIYGASVGSSGVVLITTRQAEAGKTRVNVNVSLGFERTMNLPTMLNAQQFCDVWARRSPIRTTARCPTSPNPEVYAGANVTRTDWLDEIFQTGFTQHYGVSVSGGTEKLQSILSVTYDDKEGTLLNTWSQSLGAKLHTTFKPVKWLKLSERVSFEYSNGQGNVNTSAHGSHPGRHVVPRIGIGVRPRRRREPRLRRQRKAQIRRHRLVGRHGGRRDGPEHRQSGRTARNDAPPLPADEGLLDHLAGDQADHRADDQVRIHRRPRHARGGRILARNRRAGRLDDRNTRPVLLQ